MKIQKSLERLHYTISKQNKPNENDVKAFNEVLQHFKMQNKEATQDNVLFAKLYAFTLSELLNYYTDIDFANKELNKILSEPIDLRIEILQMRLKNMELKNYFNQKRILDPFLKTKTSDELEEIHSRYIDKLPELNALEFTKCGNNWDKDAVIYNLETSINLSIQNYKNHA